MATQQTISFAEDLKPVKSRDISYGKGESSSIAGGIYPMRSRSSLRGRRSSLSRSESAQPSQEDEDPGLRSEGDYKKRQVSEVFHPFRSMC
jgi:hypothetical protein